ncbi:MAG: sigma 54-interacting transcriptional regulator [Verrucomicrobia bacterium]|jgi:transcriptional regulator with GAF, ATPase, and Fis domain|nr:sigma 54-interacting transcriptional regulator [Verrucomicrobiota bacterium]MBT7064747.1 sigma 54-interacting transcriptional regulator [Verrucomicrobiota bacterium]MBT7699173.1 sigma 54-interacting transcriptional regulator [Verrucomicrobiota bacterium]
MKVDRAGFFREVTLRICGSLDVEEALTDTFTYVEGYIPIDSIGLMYADDKERCMFPVAMVAREGFTSFWGDSREPIALDNAFREALREKQTQHKAVTIHNCPEDLPPSALGCFPHLKSCSTIGLSLRIRGHVVGGLVLSAEGMDRYTAEHAALVESIKEPVALAMSNARRYMELRDVRDQLADDNRALSADIKRMSGAEVIGADFGLREVMAMVRRVAGSNSPALLLGETGTGKEVIANAIHMASPRHKGPMIRMQCGAIPEALLDSELFGHERGAFTGASERKRGRFERADGGTLFLDEIGELSPDAQVKLLRVLQENQFERVGGTQTIHVDTRVIAATHRDLEKMVRDGRFREDLWYRLNVLPIRIPPLRLRRDDIPPLLQHFVERKAHEMNLETIPRADEETLRRLKNYDWPGNVRELQNIVERALILSRGERLSIPMLSSPHLGSEQQTVTTPSATLPTMDEAIANHIRLALEHTKGQIAGPGGAAENLQMNPSTLRFRMQKLGVQLSDPRRDLA